MSGPSRRVTAARSAVTLFTIGVVAAACTSGARSSAPASARGTIPTSVVAPRTPPRSSPSDDALGQAVDRYCSDVIDGLDTMTIDDRAAVLAAADRIQADEERLTSLGQGSVLQGRERVSNALRDFEKNHLSIVQPILPNEPIPSDPAEDFRLSSTPRACLDPKSLEHGGQSVSTGAHRVSSTFPFAATGHVVTLAVEHVDMSPGAECVDHWLTALSTPRVIYQSGCRDWGVNNHLLFFYIEIQNASSSRAQVHLGDLKVIDGKGMAHDAINGRLYAQYPKAFIPSTIELKPATSVTGWVAFRARGGIATAVAYETTDRTLLFVLLQGPQRAA